MRKKGFLFTITAMLLFLSIFALSFAYLERNKGLKAAISASSISDKLRFIEDDIVGNAYSDLLGVSLHSITRGSFVHIIFDKVILEEGRDCSRHVQEYRGFIEGNYSKLNNLDITLEKFSNNFSISPYDTSFKVNGESFYLFTMPTVYNPINSISLSAKIKGELQGYCEAPIDDGGSYPLINVTFNYIGGFCNSKRRLIPGQDNGRFFMNTMNPLGYIEVKYGKIPGLNGEGIFEAKISGISANITLLDIEYVLEPQKVIITGGILSLRSAVGDVSKETEIVLAEE